MGGNGQIQNWVLIAFECHLLVYKWICWAASVKDDFVAFQPRSWLGSTKKLHTDHTLHMKWNPHKMKLKTWMTQANVLYGFSLLDLQDKSK